MSASNLRLKLIKVGAVIIRNTRRIRVLMNNSYPYKDELTDRERRLAPGQMPGRPRPDAMGKEVSVSGQQKSNDYEPIMALPGRSKR